MTLGRLVDKKLHRYNPEEKVYVKGKYHKKKDIVRALRLEELVKERVKERTQDDKLFISTDFYTNLADDLILKILESLLEEAKK